MYNYLLNITASNKTVPLDDDLVEYIKSACKEANKSANSLQFGHTFSFTSRIDAYTLQIRLLSETALVATRATSSITRALAKLCPAEKLESLKYNGCFLSATVMEEFD